MSKSLSSSLLAAPLWASSAVLALALAGCAAQPVERQDPAATSAASTTTQAIPKGSNPSQFDEAPIAQAFDGGTVAEFDKQSDKLSKEAVDYLANINLSLHKARALEITGYCSRKDAPDVHAAQKLALARATAVRAQLRRLGIAAGKVRIKYSTVEPKHSVEIVLK